MKRLMLPPDVQPPSSYVEKVNLLTGEIMHEVIHPGQLLVRHHRDFHIVDVYVRYLMGQAVRWTHDPELVTEKVRSIRSVGKRVVDWIAGLLGRSRAVELGKKLLGYKEREYYFRYRRSALSREQASARVAALRKEATRRFRAARVDKKPSLCVLLTGGTGFIGQEVIAQAADRPEIAELVVVIRPKEIRDRKTRELIRVMSPAERGRELMDLLWLKKHPARRKFRFIEGDIEKPGLGISEREAVRLSRKLTHVIHCAASVSFDDTYENSYRANVLGSLNALAFSRRMQTAKGSRFVSHLSIETSYIHGRQTRAPAREDEIVFPRNYYNNFYEVTKAMGSIETDRYMLEQGLPVIQLCPSIVVGHSRTGNNRGDTKVVNAPVNAFGRVKQAIDSVRGSWAERSRVWMIARLATVFPGDPSAELNLIPVDRVVQGILSALTRPAAVGVRVHLATDQRLRSVVLLRTAREEIEIGVSLAEPTLHRTVTMPIVERILGLLDQPKLAGALKTLSTIFGGYSEWGQPVHEVGNDVQILGLPLPRPNGEHVFRMLCRHNRYVQEFGRVKDPREVSRREWLWGRFIHDLEKRTGRPAGSMPVKEFSARLGEAIDVASFQPREQLQKSLCRPAPGSGPVSRRRRPGGGGGGRR
ncbi:MAG: SDR family oxidoreductase [Candidatus Riflebacteria bacterium]|nr:SDR family oxidoreductase [Candidatus Riflebacteria bacterium]